MNGTKLVQLQKRNGNSEEEFGSTEEVKEGQVK
jgi:hypothetical protein